MQTELFNQCSTRTDFEDMDLGDAFIRRWAAAYSPERARQLMQELLGTIPWRQDSIRIAGQERLVPRLQCWMGDQGSEYGYSGMRLEPQPWSSPVLAIKRQTEELTDQTFNSVLLNLYRDGHDSVSWHADDERELGPAPVIASISLGAERIFELKHKHHRSWQKKQVLLQSGSLLLMSKECQNNWLHQIPKVKTLTESRVNLTFRNILPEASWVSQRPTAGKQT